MHEPSNPHPAPCSRAPLALPAPPSAARDRDDCHRRANNRRGCSRRDEQQRPHGHALRPPELASCDRGPRERSLVRGRVLQLPPRPDDRHSAGPRERSLVRGRVLQLPPRPDDRHSAGPRERRSLMTRRKEPTMRTFTLPAVGAVLLALISGCSSATGPKANSGKLGVLSSISDGAVLSDAVLWTARPVRVTDGGVSRVQFSIDGRVRWSSTTPPYAFGLSDGDTAKRLFPSLLGHGSHKLAVRVVTVGGKIASSSAQITVANTAPVPTALVGTFTRKVTLADVGRTQAFRHEPAGDQALPAGTWRLHIARNGLISFDDPGGSGGNEAFTALPAGTLTLQGPANYLNPPDRQGSFCGVEPDGAYRWAAHGRSFALTPR